jgi:hypothetical protein
LSRPFPPYEQQRRLTEDDTAKTIGRYGGRVETRTIQTTTRLNGYLDWPDVGQVCRVERVVKRDGKETREVAYALTSAGPAWADAATVLDWWRGHWGIENRVHWVRDVTMGEDKSRIRTGAAPEVMAALRNAAISLLRLTGRTNMAEALRDNLYRVRDLLTTLGIVNL